MSQLLTDSSLAQPIQVTLAFADSRLGYPSAVLMYTASFISVYSLCDQFQETLPLVKATSIICMTSLSNRIYISGELKPFNRRSFHLADLTSFNIIFFQRISSTCIQKLLKTQPYIATLLSFLIRLHHIIQDGANCDQHSKNHGDSGVITNRKHQGSATTTNQINYRKKTSKLIKKPFLKVEVTNRVTRITLCLVLSPLSISNWLIVHKIKPLSKAGIFPIFRVIIIVRRWKIWRSWDRGLEGVPSPSQGVGFQRPCHCFSPLQNVNECVSRLILEPDLSPHPNFRAGGGL